MWAGVIAALVAMWLRGRSGALAAVAALVTGVAVAAPSVAWHVHRLHAGEVPRLASRHATVAVVVKLVRDPVPTVSSPGSGLLVIDATALRVAHDGWRDLNAPVLLLARGAAWADLLPGQRVQTQARFTPPRRGDDVAAVLDAIGVPTLIGHPPWWQRAAGRARSSLREACASLPDDERGLLPSLVEGDTSKLPASLRDDMRVTGLSHLEAVSGENLGIVLGVTLAAMRGVGLRRRVRVVAAATAVVGFVVLARPSPSVQRAAVMSGVMLLAILTGRRTAARSSLAVAVAALAVLDPFLARSVGFLLSVVATAGIVVLAPPWTKRLESWMPKPVAIAVAVSAAAQLACMPVLILTFGQLTPYAIPANLAAGPAVVPATVLGVAAAVIAPISSTAVHPLVWAGSLPTGLVAWVAHGFARFPGAGATLARPAAIGFAAASMIVLLWAVRRADATSRREIL
ncbi:MAG TPA: ComEC/Rec2 family competence protein [Mycobacteriales bacterium]|nr:ComEC/Rec2 family competence protein [Mycobacteriales bacterium]